MSNLLDIAAELGSSEEDDDYDEEVDEQQDGDRQQSNGTKKVNGKKSFDDSSEEDDEEDDEEAAQAIREGFIVDEDEDDDAEARAARRREKKKRRREEREQEEDVLDEEDLDLIGEANPEFERRRDDSAPKFKRLKQGHRRSDAGDRRDRRGGDIFSDDEEEIGLEDRGYRSRAAAAADEFADFIEEDVLSDAEQQELDDEREVARPGKKVFGLTGQDLSTLDEAALEDYRAAFGNGDEYEWALQMEQEADIEQEEKDKNLELKDVFEPSVLAEKLLTDEDNAIRFRDVPERLQLARMTFKEQQLTEEEENERSREEAVWVSQMLADAKGIERHRMEAFTATVTKVLDFLNKENMEISFIRQYRKDHLIQQVEVPDESGRMVMKEERMLNDNELWDVFDKDIEFRGLMERRDAVQKAYSSLKGMGVQEDVIDDLLPKVVNMNEVQDLQDYLNFQYSAELKDLNLTEAETNGTHKRARTAKSSWERIRTSRVYSLVRNLSIGPDTLARDLKQGIKQTFPDDPTQKPDDMADDLLEPPVFSTGEQVLRAGKAMIVEEYINSPRLRKFVRELMFRDGMFDCVRTEKGARVITEDHRYYEFKYLRNQPLRRAAQNCELFLRMLKAESEGLVVVKFSINDIKPVQRRLRSFVVSDNLSEVAEAWNALRQQVIDEALNKLVVLIAKSVKETLKSACEDKLAKACRESFRTKLDQAPYKPVDAGLGTIPNVFALTNGEGGPRDPIYWTYVNGDDGRILDSGKIADFKLGNKDRQIPHSPGVQQFWDLVDKYKPDVLGVSGFSMEARRLLKDIQEVVEDPAEPLLLYFKKDDVDVTEPIPVVMVNDETARLYHTSDRAATDCPRVAPLVRYCFGLCRYLQDPTAEYIALGQKALTSIIYHPDQDLIPREKLLKYLEMAIVEIVNLKGVDINEAVSDQPRLGQQMQYIAGLGPRKVQQVIKALVQNDGIQTRSDLVGDPDNNVMQAVSGKIFQNCAGFLYIQYERTDDSLDPLDDTRIHPEDYDLARKIAADAMEMDEEDIKAENDEHGPSGTVKKMRREKKEELVDDLELEHYADALKRDFNQLKRAALEQIRVELQEPHEELRYSWQPMKSDDLFTMLTGETSESLQTGMIIPVKIRRFLPDTIEVRLDCGLEGHISASEWPEGMGGDRGTEPRSVYSINQTVQAKLIYLDRKKFTVNLSIRERAVKEPFKRVFDHTQEEWDFQQEAKDKRDVLRAKEDVSGRAQRVIKHPLFRPFNATQAEEFLGSQPPGSVVIRPSSRGFDHLVVTWKVADNVYQHVDVLEMKKENEFALGKLLRIGNYTYTDLDELIVNHVQGMARKVDEMMHDERFQALSKREADEWLQTYTEANPRRSMYAFCINPKYPGYFHLIFKEGLQGTLCSWNVKTIPGAFELNKTQYPDMRSLRNGLKMQLESSKGGGGMGNRR